MSDLPVGEICYFCEFCETTHASNAEIAACGPREAARRLLVERALADDRVSSGELEVDLSADISPCSEENGAYVQAWIWVSYEGTPLFKEQKEKSQ